MLRYEGNLNSYVSEVLQPKIFPFLQSISGAIFQQHNASSHVAKTVRNFCSANHIEVLPWPAYSSDMSPCKHMWDFVGRRLVRDPRPAASKGEF